jgi:hypothetical protein
LIFNKSYDKPWFYDAFSFANNLYIVPHILTDFSNKYNWSCLIMLYIAKENLIAPFATFLITDLFLNWAIFQVQGRNYISVTFFIY